MSTVSIDRSFFQQLAPAGYQDARCWHCNAAIFVREDTPESPCCDQCRGALAEGEAMKITSDIRSLVEGRDVFEFIPADQRQAYLRQIRQLVLSAIRPSLPSRHQFPGVLTEEGVCFPVPNVEEVEAMMDTEELSPEHDEAFAGGIR